MPEFITHTPKGDIFDRNFTSFLDTFSATVGPHALTARFSETALTTKKTTLMNGVVTVTRVTVAAPIGFYYAKIQLDGEDVVRALSMDNTVGAQKQDSRSGIDTYTTTTWRGITADASTGGTVRYDLDMILGNYDA